VLFRYLGTFAVISLMVGQVVNRGYQSHVGLKVLSEGNSTYTPGIQVTHTGVHLTNATLAAMNPHIEPLVHQAGYANPVKLGHALSLTFVVGVVQVN